jgi:hypothetical protein
LSLLPSQQLGLFREVRRHPPRLIPGQQLGRRAQTELFLEVEIRQRLPVLVADDEARVVVFFERSRVRESGRATERGIRPSPTSAPGPAR